MGTRQRFSLTRVTCVAALTALLAACGGGGGGGGGANLADSSPTAEPNRVVLGPLSGTTIRAYRLDNLAQVIEGPFAAHQSLTDLNRAGSFTLSLTGVPDDAWVLVKATGGQDIDANDDGVLDPSPSTNAGSVHALARAGDWRNGGTNVTVLSDIAWLYAQDVTQDEVVLEQRMNSVAVNLLREDINGDGVINRRDIEAFAPVQHKERTQQNYEEMLPDDDPATTTLVELIHGNAPDHAKSDKFREQVDETTWQNIAPTALAGAGQSVNEQTPVTLQGTVGDSDGQVVSILWAQSGGPAVSLSATDTATTSFVAPVVTEAKTLTFTLTVTDDQGARSTGETRVTVNPVNGLPQVNAGEDLTVNEYTLVELTGSATDADGSVVSYGWSQVGGTPVILSGADTPVLSFRAPILTQPRVLSFELAVTDNEGGVATDLVTVTVNPVNVPPAANAGPDQSLEEQTTVTLSGAGSDSDGTVVGYDWRQLSGPAVALASADTAQASFVAPAVTASALLEFELRVTDNEGAAATDTVAVTVNPANVPPTADAGADRSLDEQAAVILSGAGSDSDGTITAYSWRQLSGPLVALANADAAQASFTAPVVTAIEVLEFELTVTDNAGATAADTVAVTVNPVNAPPTADAGADRSLEEQTSVTLSGSGSDSDGTVVGYGWRQLSGPAVSLSDAGTAQASFVAPAVTASALLEFELAVTDNEGASATDTVAITVNPRVRVTVSGTLTAAGSQFVDSDVNDPAAAYASNDTPATAQPIPNPATVGGFASAFGTGFIGDRFGSIGDMYDAYAVTLSAGETVTLQISDFNSVAPAFYDLDLYLYDAADPTSPVAYSISLTATESLQAPTSGNFHVLVKASYGYSNYTLTLGQGALGASKEINSFSASDESFLPSELIVEMHEEVASDPRLTGQQKMQAVQQRLNDLGVNAKAGGPGRPLLVDLGDAQKRQQTLAQHNPKRKVNQQPAWSYGAQQETVETLQILKALQAQEDVKAAGLNYLRKPQAVPTDPYYSYQWHYPLINLPQAWDLSTGSNVVVAVVDTGVFMTHPDLAANLTDSGYDFISNTSISVDGDGIDSNPDDPGDDSNSFHGTHVAGTVAAVSNNNMDGAGVAWNARVMPIRVLGWGGGTDYDVLQGVRYAAGLSNDSGTVPATPAQVINLSLGGAGYNATFQNSLYEVRNAGTIVVAAAGNSATSIPSYPAAYDGVVSVSSVRYDKTLAYYSNFGSTIDLAAPGGDTRVDQNGDFNGDGVLSTWVDKSSGTRQPAAGFMQGTSMAAPHVAGVVALMKSVYPAMTPAEFDSALASGALTEDLGNDGATVRNDSYGYGLIDSLKAVQHASELANGEPLAPRIGTDKISLSFGTAGISETLEVSNVGGGDLYITDVSGDANWLSVTPGSVDANNLGTYSVTVDRTGLSDGDYSATLTVSSDTAGTLAVSVSMSVSTLAAQTPDVGYQWVLLVDAATFTTVKEVGVAADDGLYSYSFSDVVPGAYYVIAGSDSDNDYEVCDPGESCGGYPEAAGATVLNIQADTTGIDFTTGYGTPLSTLATGAKPNGFKRLP